MGARLLAIDDDEASCRLMKAIFAGEGFEVDIASDGESGLLRAAADLPDVVVLDLRLPGIDGLEVLERLRQRLPDLPVVLLTAHAEVKSAVRATQLGAFDYLVKPIDHEELLVVIRRALETGALRAEVRQLRQQIGDGGGLVAQMGRGAEVARIVEQVRTVAGSSFSVLILGETGTGKELIAQAVHRLSERHGRPFVALDCGAIPDALLESELFGHEKGAFTGAERRREGRFHLAEGGTLFLDEIGNLPLGLQAKLLRVLESRQLQAVGATAASEMDVRFVAATNDDLRERVAAGRFRADPYFRLAQYTISLPPLRARRADVAHLAARFLAEASLELRRPVQEIAPETLAALVAYAWPGNVRELRNVIRQAVLESSDLVLRPGVVQRHLGQAASATAAPASASPAPPAAPAAGRSLREAAEDAAREAERQAIREALRTSGGNKSQAARALRTDFKTLHTKMKALGIRARDFSA